MSLSLAVRDSNGDGAGVQWNKRAKTLPNRRCIGPDGQTSAQCPVCGPSESGQRDSSWRRQCRRAKVFNFLRLNSEPVLPFFRATGQPPRNVATRRPSADPRIILT
uniref:Uncharacterized protein n=1 Tax=Plectus sambesii TaxID=2011161 RepID=A0A914UJU2_9BILA